MPKYESKTPETVEAIQWTGDNLEAVHMFMQGMPLWMSEKRDINCQPSETATLTVPLGDYIVKNSVLGNTALARKPKDAFEKEWKLCIEEVKSPPSKREVQWTGTDDSYQELREFMGNSEIGADVKFLKGIGRVITITTDGGAESLREGDYIVRYPDGSCYKCAEENIDEWRRSVKDNLKPAIDNIKAAIKWDGTPECLELCRRLIDRETIYIHGGNCQPKLSVRPVIIPQLAKIGDWLYKLNNNEVVVRGAEHEA